MHDTCQCMHAECQSYSASQHLRISPNSLPDLCVRETSPVAVLDKGGGRALAVPADIPWRSLEPLCLNFSFCSFCSCFGQSPAAGEVARSCGCSKLLLTVFLRVAASMSRKTLPPETASSCCKHVGSKLLMEYPP